MSQGCNQYDVLQHDHNLRLSMSQNTNLNKMEMDQNSLTNNQNPINMIDNNEILNYIATANISMLLGLESILYQDVISNLNLQFLSNQGNISLVDILSRIGLMNCNNNNSGIYSNSSGKIS